MELSSNLGLPIQQPTQQNPLQVAARQNNNVHQFGKLNNMPLALFKPFDSSKEVLDRIVSQSRKSQERAMQALKSNAEEFALKDREIVVLRGQIDELKAVHREEIDALLKNMQTRDEELGKKDSELSEVKKALSIAQDSLNKTQRAARELQAKANESSRIHQHELGEVQRRFQISEENLKEKTERLGIAEEKLLNAQAVLNNVQREKEDLRAHSQEANNAHAEAMCASQRRVQVSEEELANVRRELAAVQAALERSQAALNSKTEEANRIQAQLDQKTLQVVNAAAVCSEKDVTINKQRNAMKAIRAACGQVPKRSLWVGRGKPPVVVPACIKVRPLFNACNAQLKTVGI